MGRRLQSLRGKLSVFLHLSKVLLSPRQGTLSSLGKIIFSLFAFLLVNSSKIGQRATLLSDLLRVIALAPSF